MYNTICYTHKSVIYYKSVINKCVIYTYTLKKYIFQLFMKRREKYNKYFYSCLYEINLYIIIYVYSEQV